MGENEEELYPEENQEEEEEEKEPVPERPEDVTIAVEEAAKAVQPPPSIVFSSNSNNSSSNSSVTNCGNGGNRALENLQRQITRVWRQGFSKDSRKGFFDPEHLTSQKRQWAQLQMQMLVSSSFEFVCLLSWMNMIVAY